MELSENHSNSTSISLGVVGGIAEIKSPLSSAASRGKTIKEYEDELTELRRDNFDLRMRIYLMEDQEERDSSVLNQIASDHLQNLSASKPTSTFAVMKELYYNNNLLKTEISNLKKQLKDKEAALNSASLENEILEKDNIDRIDKLREEFQKERRELLEEIAQLTEELQCIKEVNKFDASHMSTDSKKNLNDTSILACRAFNVPITLTPNKRGSISSEVDQRIMSLDCQLSALEKELKEETARRVDIEMELERSKDCLVKAERTAASELASRAKEEDLRKSIKDQLTNREIELAKAHRIIEEKCLTIESLQQILTKSSCNALNDKSGCDYERSGEGLSDLEKQVQVLVEKVKSKEAKIESLRADNMKALRTIQGFVKQNKALSRDLETMKVKTESQSKDDSGVTSTSEKDDYIQKLESEIKLVTEELNGLKNVLSDIDDKKGTRDACGLILYLRSDLDLKKREVEILNEELRKRTFNLQELVNTELWDKNREIEKLNKSCEKKQSEVINLKQELALRNNELASLNETVKTILNVPFVQDFDFKENQDPNMLLNQILDAKLKENVKCLTDENLKLHCESENIKQQLIERLNECELLKEEVKKFKREAEESEKGKKELVNACTLLTTRLEELSTFLESLLPSLGSKKRRMLQQAIDRSREMSRSFSFMDQSSLSIPILPDVSQVEFCSGDESLKVDVKVPVNDEVVQLRTQVESLVDKLKKKESVLEMSKAKKAIWTLGDGEILEDVSEGSLVDSLDSDSSSEEMPVTTKARPSVSIVAHPVVELSPMNSLFAVGCLSESDGGWSEPDRNVSKERIGITDSVNQRNIVHSTDDSSRSFRKSPSVGRKSRTEEKLHLRRLSAKLDSLEQVNEVLQAKVLMLHQTGAVSHSNTQRPLSPLALLEKTRLPKRNSDCGKDNNSNENYKSDFIPESRLLDQIEEMSRVCLVLEERVSKAEEERDTATLELAALSNELDAALASGKEKENSLLEKQCSLLEANNNILVLNARVESLTQTVTEKQLTIEHLEKELKDSKNHLVKVENDFKSKVKKLESDSQSKQEEYLNKLKTIERNLEDESKMRGDAEKRLIESIDVQAELRTRLDSEIFRANDLEDRLKADDRCWKRRLAEIESARADREAELRRKLDNAVLTTSEAVLDRTRLANDKLRLQHDMRTKEASHFAVVKEYERRIAELENEVREVAFSEIRQDPVGSSPRSAQSMIIDSRSPVRLSCPRSPPPLQFALPHGPISPSINNPLSPRSPQSPSSLLLGPLSPRSLPTTPPPLSQNAALFLSRQRSHPSSDYVSDQEQVWNFPLYSLPTSIRCNNNSSPDLGIESDQHSLTMLPSIPSLDPLPQLSSSPPRGDVNKLEAENTELRLHLLKTRKALEDTLSQLTTANQKKKQVERAICKQLHKTHHILQKARVNLESDSH